MLPLAQTLGVTIEEMYKVAAKSKKPLSVLRRGMDAVAGHPLISYPLAATPGVLSYLLFVLFGVSTEKNMLLIMTPIMCALIFGGGLLVFGLQIKNPFNNSTFLDWATALMFISLSLLCLVPFIHHLVNPAKGYVLATPLVSSLLSMLLTLHRMRMRRHH